MSKIREGAEIWDENDAQILATTKHAVANGLFSHVRLELLYINTNANLL